MIRWAQAWKSIAMSLTALLSNRVSGCHGYVLEPPLSIPEKWAVSIIRGNSLRKAYSGYYPVFQTWNCIAFYRQKKKGIYINSSRFWQFHIKERFSRFLNFWALVQITSRFFTLLHRFSYFRKWFIFKYFYILINRLQKYDFQTFVMDNILKIISQNDWNARDRII